MTRQHTPGPWTALPNLVIVDANKHPVAYCSSTRGKYEAEAPNARLIAAAPELLEALLECVSAIERTLHCTEADRLAAAEKAAPPSPKLQGTKHEPTQDRLPTLARLLRDWPRNGLRPSNIRADGTVRYAENQDNRKKEQSMNTVQVPRETWDAMRAERDALQDKLESSVNGHNQIFALCKTLEVECDALREENERLSACLSKANSNHEEFERKWYLACDERDALQDKLDALEQQEPIGVLRGGALVGPIFEPAGSDWPLGPVYAAPVPAQPKQPLTAEQIDKGQWDDGTSCTADFSEGVRFAERHHGITGEQK